MELNPLVKKMTKRQNTSYAVMAQRIEAQDNLDDFPTPPWATRALIEHVLGGKKRVKSQVCLEPACGSGHMAKVLSEYFGKVKAADIHPYGYGGVHDFLATPHETNGFGVLWDEVITALRAREYPDVEPFAISNNTEGSQPDTTKQIRGSKA